MRFQRLYPNVKVEITELDMIKIERALLDQTIDIALLLQGTRARSVAFVSKQQL
jgi:DNA-binding transcriptional LysR family regulator